MKIAIMQSNYIPWKGYFDMINMVDKFIIYDIVQYTKNDWRNRNVIIGQNGPEWITIPVKVDSLNQTIQETQVAQLIWNKKHRMKLQTNYAKAPFFHEIKDFLFQIYESVSTTSLSEINLLFIKRICEYLNINTPILSSTDFNLKGDKNERLIQLCKANNANVYLSGPAAKDYIDLGLFEENKIEVHWMDYQGYKEYNQQSKEFHHSVSILDLLFNEGKNSYKYLKSFNNE